MYGVTGDQLTAIADAIRLKTDNPASMSVDDMPLQIGLIPTGTDIGLQVYKGSVVATSAVSFIISDIPFTPKFAYAIMDGTPTGMCTYGWIRMFQETTGSVGVMSVINSEGAVEATQFTSSSNAFKYSANTLTAYRRTSAYPIVVGATYKFWIFG